MMFQRRWPKLVVIRFHTLRAGREDAAYIPLNTVPLVPARREVGRSFEVPLFAR